MANKSPKMTPLMATPYSEITAVRTKVADTVVGHYGVDFTVGFGNMADTVVGHYGVDFTVVFRNRQGRQALISRWVFGTGRAGRR
jgi:hypothetical protein